MGMCGVPLVTSNVGAYYDRPSGAWGESTNTDWHGAIERSANLDGMKAALYWRDEGFTLKNCMSMWSTTVRALGVADVIR
jgi:hypothetical protein